MMRESTCKLKTTGKITRKGCMILITQDSSLVEITNIQIACSAFPENNIVINIGYLQISNVVVMKLSENSDRKTISLSTPQSPFPVFTLSSRSTLILIIQPITVCHPLSRPPISHWRQI